MIKKLRVIQIIVIIAALVLLNAGEADAHKIKVFATGNGKSIEGKAYFSGGGKLINARVLITSESGEKLGEVKTDKNGKFSFPVKYYCNHVLAVDNGDGHQAEWIVSRGELSDSLPRLPSVVDSEGKTTPVKKSGREDSLVVPSALTSSLAAPSPLTNFPAGELKDDLKRLYAQITLMREELDDFREEIRLRDILGGVGFLIGISGIAFYFLAKKQNWKTTQ